MSTIHKIIMFCLFTIMLIPTYVFAELKMGIVNLDLLFKEIPIYRESQEKIKKQFDPRARNLKTLEQEWNGLNEDYLKNETVMSEKEKKALVKKIQDIEKNSAQVKKKYNQTYKKYSKKNFQELEQL